MLYIARAADSYLQQPVLSTPVPFLLKLDSTTLVKLLRYRSETRRICFLFHYESRYTVFYLLLLHVKSKDISRCTLFSALQDQLTLFSFVNLPHPSNHFLGFNPLTRAQDAGLSEDVNRLGDDSHVDALGALGEADRLEPLAGVLLGVVELGADVLDGFVLVLVEVLDALVELLHQILNPVVQLLLLLAREEFSAGDNLPATPGRVNLTHAADLTVVVVALGREVLPHEEVDLAAVGGVAQVLKRVEHDKVGVGLRARVGASRGGGQEPAALVR